jgi:hypothetical protein
LSRFRYISGAACRFAASPGGGRLFSARALHAVTYAALDAENRCVNVTFEPGEEGMKGALRFRFIQSAVWADYPIFDIRLDNSEDEDSE